MAAVWIELEGRRDRIVHLAAELEEEEFGSPVATSEDLGNALNGVVDSAMARLAFEPARFVRERLIGARGEGRISVSDTASCQVPEPRQPAHVTSPQERTSMDEAEERRHHASHRGLPALRRT